jgi:hypothetical protein
MATSRQWTPETVSSFSRRWHFLERPTNTSRSASVSFVVTPLALHSIEMTNMVSLLLAAKARGVPMPALGVHLSLFNALETGAAL